MRTQQEIIQWLKDKKWDMDNIPVFERLKIELLLDIREILNGGPV